MNLSVNFDLDAPNNPSFWVQLGKVGFSHIRTGLCLSLCLSKFQVRFQVQLQV